MPLIDPHAEYPDVYYAYKIAVTYIDKRAGALTQQQIESAIELKRRIKRLSNDCNRLIKINNLLIDVEMPQIQFDETSGMMTITHQGISKSIKWELADPKVPAKLGNSTALHTYHAGHNNQPQQPEYIEDLKMDMEQRPIGSRHQDTLPP